MTITSISYQKTYNLGNFSSERIGVELSLNENEDPMLALRTAKELCDEYHKETTAVVLPERTTTTTAISEPEPIIKVDKKSAKEQQEANMIKLITSCKQIEGADGLKTYEKLAKSNPKFQIAYDDTYNQLKHLI